MNVFDIGETFSGLELFGYSTFPAIKSHYFFKFNCYPLKPIKS